MRTSPVVVVALFTVTVTSALLSFSTPALATPRPLPFTYTADTLGEGETEIENYVDMTPVKATSAITAKPVWYTATQFQAEYEHGITDNLELGLYVAFQPDPGAAYTNTATLTEGTGFKERLRWHALQYGDFGLALYGELVEYETEFEIEAKVILEQRFGNLRIAANAWVERELYYAQLQHDWVLNPTIGATYQITPAFHAGLEYWMRVEYTSLDVPRTFNLEPNQFLGPALMFNFGNFWWSTGVYARLNDIDRVAQPGDDYGPIWVRTVLGIEL